MSFANSELMHPKPTDFQQRHYEHTLEKRAVLSTDGTGEVGYPQTEEQTLTSIFHLLHNQPKME
jgi:hypothetical protein